MDHLLYFSARVNTIYLIFTLFANLILNIKILINVEGFLIELRV